MLPEDGGPLVDAWPAIVYIGRMTYTRDEKNNGPRKRRIKIDEVIWYPIDTGALCTDVYDARAGEIVLEAGPRVGCGRFYAQALGFLAVTIWERDDFESLEEAQIQILTWWKHVTDLNPKITREEQEKRWTTSRQEREGPGRA